MDDLEPDHRSDPHRRLLRHTYQEGPGLPASWRPAGVARRAARAARTWPPAASVPAAVRTAREEGIAAALALGRQPGEPPSLARPLRRRAASRRSVDRPRGPAAERLPAWVEQAVIVVRLLTYWNSKRLAAEFTRRDIYPLGHHAVDALLAELRHGPTVGPPGARPGLRAEPTQRAVAHRHQGSLLPAARAGRVHEGLDRRPRRRPLAASSSACASCPGPQTAPDPRLARRLPRAVRHRRSS